MVTSRDSREYGSGRGLFESCSLCITSLGTLTLESAVSLSHLNPPLVGGIRGGSSDADSASADFASRDQEISASARWTSGVVGPLGSLSTPPPIRGSFRAPNSGSRQCDRRDASRDYYDASPNPHCDASPNLHHDTSPNLHHDTSPNLHHDTSPNLHHDTSPNLDGSGRCPRRHPAVAFSHGR